jgi:MraZ protein
VFVGEFLHALDDKNRLAIPASFRQELAGGLYLCKGIDRCLYALPVETWTRLAQRIAALSLATVAARQLQRHFFAGATHGVPDKLGRLVIPQPLREYAGLTRDVVLAGAYTRIEIWNPEDWTLEAGRAVELSRALAEQMVDIQL